MKEFNFVVIGSGIAGLSFALKAARVGRVALVTKRGRADSNTAWAQGGIACVIDSEDSFESHIQDTITAGAGLCREDIVRTIITEGPKQIAELIAMGMPFDKRTTRGGQEELDLGIEGGHSKRRILHFRDSTGNAIEKTLLDRVMHTPNITLLENHMAVDLITSAKLELESEKRCVGVYVLDEETGIVETIRADTTILATGGCGKVYLYSTNPDIATGDGVAIAWRAGAAIANMEFIQFHPTCLYHPQEKSFLITEAIRGEGGILQDEKGVRFMEKYHPLQELAPRDIVARAIDAEMKRSGSKCVYLDISHKPSQFITTRFPNIYETCLRLGIDITRVPIPVVPAAHYQCGGVLTGVDGETNLRGLYAVGEVACTGLHGANRLASNSLLEALVMAHRAFERSQGDQHATAHYDLPEWDSAGATEIEERVFITHIWEAIRRLMWDYVGIVRTDKRLHRAAVRLEGLRKEVDEIYWNFRVSTDTLELRNLVTVASLIVDCAIRRKESRGLHYTLDHLESEPNLSQDTIVHRSES